MRFAIEKLPNVRDYKIVGQFQFYLLNIVDCSFSYIYKIDSIF